MNLQLSICSLFITEKYHEIAGTYPSEEVANYFNNDQHTLNTFCVFHSEIENGGFIQLIQNGYGNHIFNELFSECIAEWGAKEISQIIEKARIHYIKNKQALEKETSLNEFSQLYKEHTYFEPIENHYHDIIEQEINIISKYVHQNLNHFVEII